MTDEIDPVGDFFPSYLFLYTIVSNIFVVITVGVVETVEKPFFPCNTKKNNACFPCGQPWERIGTTFLGELCCGQPWRKGENYGNLCG